MIVPTPRPRAGTSRKARRRRPVPIRAGRSPGRAARHIGLILSGPVLFGPAWPIAAHAELPGPVSAFPVASAPDSRARQETCLADAISYEAGNEPETGREAVAQVILNRLHDPAYPKTVCQVVFQGSERRTGCQFTFACDGSMIRRQPGAATWAEALRIARLALDGQLASPIMDATHYHAFYVTPAWAGRLTQIGRIGAHIFYGAPLRGAAPASASASRTAGAAAPKAVLFSAWGLETAMLVPTATGVLVRAEPAAGAALGIVTPPPESRTATLPTR